ncbi:T9SS type A sorting domain-containing protein [Hymenobacter koreensis]|uniref:T9SS type A sorting domain-containing protein n=1 Tax=Hymenobacter koreensis TaxID=1084523 RepID=A0ABP8IYI7_9BACT
MSQHNSKPLKMLAVNFPIRVNVPAIDRANIRNRRWQGFSQQVLEKIRTDYQAELQSLNPSQLDARTNGPRYLTDNSTSAPDNQIDYTIIVWRYAGGSPYGTTGLDLIQGSGGGYASVPYVELAPATSTSAALYTAHGFTQCVGMAGMNKELFTHEFGHTLYDAPHYLHANGVTGSHYYSSEGYGMIGGPMRMCANGWERWLLNWAPLQASGVSGDVWGAGALPTSGEYTLRDFITSGDMLRIRLPHTYDDATDTWQHLWLENHQNRSVWDGPAWTLDGRTPPQAFPQAGPGLQAYVEDMEMVRNMAPYFWDGLGAGGLKFLSADGNFDADWSGAASTFGLHLWLPQNVVYDMGHRRPNPTSGQCELAPMRYDTNGNNRIDYDPYINSGGRNEFRPFWSLNGQLVDGMMGARSPFWQVGHKIGLDRNPMPLPHQSFDLNTQQLSPLYLNGISVRIVNVAANGDITVRVRFNDTSIHSTRWTGELHVNDVPDATNGYDVNVLTDAVLLLDRSATPQRTTRSAAGDFINPTRLTCRNGATVHVERISQIVLGAGSTFYVEDHGQLVIDEEGRVTVENEALLSVPTQAMADELTRYGQLELQRGGRLEIRDRGVVIVGRNAGASLTLNTYPNPASARQVVFELRGAGAGTPYQYRVLNAYGRPVRAGRCSGAEAARGVTVPDVPAGAYLLEVLSADGRQRVTRRVQVNP